MWLVCVGRALARCEEDTRQHIYYKHDNGASGSAGWSCQCLAKQQEQLLIEILILAKLPCKAPALVGGPAALPGQYDLHIHDD